jgi:hypothetical protein
MYLLPFSNNIYLRAAAAKNLFLLEQTERQRDAGIAGVKPVSLAVKGMHVRLGFAAPEED